MPELLDRMMSFAWKGCFGVSVLAAAAAFALYYYQENILYMPNPTPQMSKLTTGNQKRYRKPSEYTRKGRYHGAEEGNDSIPYEDTFVPTRDGEKIHVWLLYHPLTTARRPVPTLVWFHMYVVALYVTLIHLFCIDILSWKCWEYGISIAKCSKDVQ